MFDITAKTCRLTNVNGRHEKHGDENVFAADLELAADFSNDVLAEFAPALRSCLYERDDDGDLDARGQDRPTKLRFPKLVQPLKWDDEIVGATVTIDYGFTPLTFELVQVNKFRIELKEGGTVTVQFRLQLRPTEEQVAKLLMRLDSEVAVTIEPPEARAEAA